MESGSRPSWGTYFHLRKPRTDFRSFVFTTKAGGTNLFSSYSALQGQTVRCFPAEKGGAPAPHTHVMNGPDATLMGSSQT